MDGAILLPYPACDPRLYAVERNRSAALQEFAEPAPVFGDVRTREIDDRIEQRNGFGQNGRDILPALGRHFGQARVGAGIDFQSTANDVHRGKIVPAARLVERASRRAAPASWHLQWSRKKPVDARHKAGHDGRERP